MVFEVANNELPQNLFSTQKSHQSLARKGYMCSETPVIRMSLSLLAEGKGSEMACILGLPSVALTRRG